MNAQNHDELERMLGRELHGRVDGLHDSPFGLADVKGRATRIRRTRAALATGAVAAVAAALVPVALLAGGTDRAAGPQTAERPSASRTADPAPEPAERAPAFLVDGRVHTSDGRVFTPQVSGETPWFAGVGDGRWVFSVYEEAAEGVTVHVLDENGAELATHPAAETGLASDGTSVAWHGKDGRLRVLQPGRDEPTVFGATDGPDQQHVRHILGGDCESEGCAVLVEAYTGSEPTVYRVEPTGAVEKFLPGVLDSVSDVSDDGTLAAGLTQVTNEGSCSAVVDIASSKVLWGTCRSSGLRFSPGGDLVLGIDPYLDGANHSLQLLFDADSGKDLARHETVIYDEAWDSPTSWISVEGSFRSSSVMRYTWTGSDLRVEAVHGPTPNDAEDAGSAYHLER